MVRNLSELKMRDFPRYEKFCQKLANRKLDPKHQEIIKEGGQKYRLSRSDLKFINSLKKMQDTRHRRMPWRQRLMPTFNAIFFVGFFLGLLFIFSPLLELNEELSRSMGGSLLFGAALMVLTNSILDRAKEQGNFWGALSAYLCSNPLKNPILLACVGAGIMFIVDWWPHFGSKLIPNLKDLMTSFVG